MGELQQIVCTHNDHPTLIASQRSPRSLHCRLGLFVPHLRRSIPDGTLSTLAVLSVRCIPKGLTTNVRRGARLGYDLHRQVSVLPDVRRQKRRAVILYRAGSARLFQRATVCTPLQELEWAWLRQRAVTLRWWGFGAGCASRARRWTLFCISYFVFFPEPRSRAAFAPPLPRHGAARQFFAHSVSRLSCERRQRRQNGIAWRNNPARKF